jgi:hypothetical protein
MIKTSPQHSRNALPAFGGTHPVSVDHGDEGAARARLLRSEARRPPAHTSRARRGSPLARAVALREETPVPVNRNIRSLNDQLAELYEEHDKVLSSPLDAVSLKRALQLVPQISMVLIQMHSFFVSNEGRDLFMQALNNGHPGNRRNRSTKSVRLKEMEHLQRDTLKANEEEQQRWAALQRHQRAGALLFAQQPMTPDMRSPLYPTVKALIEAAGASTGLGIDF